MAGTGPAPNPDSRKQAGRLAHTWTNLPAGGFDGDVPEWPLPSPSDRELVLWGELWRTPQAAAWAPLRWTADVALYVRVLTLAEVGDAKAIPEARLRSIELGLTPTGLLKNRWLIAADEVAEKRSAKDASSSKVRRRLKVADGAVAGS